MSGIDEILGLIEAQQKQTEDGIRLNTESIIKKIKAEGQQNAQKAYDDYMQKAEKQAKIDYENSWAAIDADMKRKVLSCKVEIINQTIDKVHEKLRSLSDNDYSELLIRLAERCFQPSDGIISLCSRDMARIPSDFEKKLSELAEKKGGTIKLSSEPADIEDGFVLSYGLISENCSFSAMLEAEKDEIRDIAARELFRQVK